MTGHRIYSTSFASVYPLYVAKAERKGRTKAEVDAIIRWLTGYRPRELARQLKIKANFATTRCFPGFVLRGEGFRRSFESFGVRWGTAQGASGLAGFWPATPACGVGPAM